MLLFLPFLKHFITFVFLKCDLFSDVNIARCYYARWEKATEERDY